jgi:hypothetical protein
MEAKQEQPVTTDFLDSEAQAADPQLYTQQASSKNQIPEADYISFTDGEAGKEETLCKSQNFRLDDTSR